MRGTEPPDSDERHPEDPEPAVGRRRVLAAGTAGAAMLAGCLGNDNADNDGDGDTEDDGPRTERYAEFDYEEGAVEGEADHDGNPDLIDLDWGEFELVLEDPAEDLESLHESSDVDDLQIADWNAFETARPPYADEAVDDARFARAAADATDVDLVYGPFDGVEGIRIEAHYDFYDGPGETAFAFSTDDGEGWTAFEPEYFVYDDQDGDWDAEEPGSGYLNTLYVHREFPEGVTHVRLTLVDGEEDWTPQFGHVEVYE